LHAGVSDDFMGGLSEVDIAASAQRLLQRLIGNVMRRARDFEWSTNLVYQGGVALNCLANTQLGNYFENIWIMPNPGDAGSSLGAAALAYGNRLHWNNAYLGHNIPGSYPVDSVVFLVTRYCAKCTRHPHAACLPAALPPLTVLPIRVSIFLIRVI
jgi:carbamoyltransferase